MRYVQKVSKQKPSAMKNPRGLRKISINAANGKVNGFKTFVKEIMQGREMLVEPGLSVLALPDGLIFEFFGVGSNCPDYLFSHSNIVNTYQVNDIQFAVEGLKEQGAILLGKIVNMAPSCYYCHLNLADGSVIGLIQHNTGAGIYRE